MYEALNSKFKRNYSGALAMQAIITQAGWTNSNKCVMIRPHERGDHLSGAGGLRVGPSPVEEMHPGAPGLEPSPDYEAYLPALGLAHADWPAKDLCGAQLY